MTKRSGSYYIYHARRLVEATAVDGRWVMILKNSSTRFSDDSKVARSTYTLDL